MILEDLKHICIFLNFVHLFDQGLYNFVKCLSNEE